MATIRDVALAAGVSTATVSNVLNGRSDRVSQPTTQKVLSTVRALKYRPTALEHKQKAIQSKNIGFNVTDMTEEAFRSGGYHQDVLHGALEGAASQGYSLTIFIEKIWADVGLRIRRSYDGRCDGLIMVAPQPGNEIFEMLHARGTPIVTVGSTPWLPGVSSVDVDNLAVGAEAARRLFELGHRRLAVVLDGRPQVSALERKDGFVTEARKLGLPEEDVAVVLPPRLNDVVAEDEATIQALTAAPARTGAFFWHDGLAARIVQTLRRKGVRIPEDLSVIAVDDALEARREGITTFKNPTYELGKRAARVLIDRISDGNEITETIRFAPEIVVRASTAERA